MRPAPVVSGENGEEGGDLVVEAGGELQHPHARSARLEGPLHTRTVRSAAAAPASGQIGKNLRLSRTATENLFLNSPAGVFPEPGGKILLGRAL